MIKGETMKKLMISIAVLCLSLNSFAAHHENGEKHDHKEGSAMSIDTEQSEIEWVGAKKFVDGKHNGTVKFKSGEVYFKDGEPIHGDFVIDMTTIKNTDLEDEAYRAKLEGHLNSEDFFAVENYKEAKFTFDNVKSLGENQYALTGEMEIRGVKKPETVQATIIMNEDGTGFTANADVVIDRVKYGVSYNAEGEDSSNEWFFVKWFKGGVKTAKDKIIKNDMNLNIKLVAEK
jgi:polyisoprenoid-binding protein YceI